MSQSHLVALSLLISTSSFAHAPALETVLDTTRANAARGVKSLLVMDIDETVVDTHTRKYLAYRMATETLCGTAASTIQTPKSDDCERAFGLSMHDIYRSDNGYSAPELMTKLGIKNPVFIQELFRLRRDNEGLPQFFAADTLMPGASEFVRAFRRAGGSVYYVSSRGEDRVADVTYEQMIRLGLITENEKSFVILRKPGQGSVEFKRESARFLKEKSTREGTPVIGLFENEPENLLAWISEFPNSKAFFVKGSFVTSAPIPAAVNQIESYR